MTLDFNDAPTRAQIALIDNAAWDARVERVRARLKQDVRDFVTGLYPRARLTTAEARIGSVAGEDGESLSISLTGEAAGRWYDHATGEGGDAIELWIRTQGYGQGEFAKAVSDLEVWCGISDQPRWRSPVTKVAEQRKKEAAKLPALAEFTGLGAPTGVWHYHDAEGNIHSAQQRYEPRPGEKDYRPKCFRDGKWVTGAPAQRILYRLPQIMAANTVVLVEGEKCADALANLGIEATTAMGGSNAPIDKTDWTPLIGKRVILWPDNDRPGFDHMERVKAELIRLGVAVSEVSLPPGKPEKWDAANAIAEETDVLSILGTAGETGDNTAAPQTARPKIPIYSRGQLRDLKRPEWVVDETIVEASVIALYGPSGSLKSFVAIDLAMSVATGLQWHGRDVKQGPVIYVTGEGRDQIGLRLDAWERAHNYTGEAAIFVVPFGVPVSDPVWVGHLIQAIEEASPTPPAMIWLDTLARTFGTGDENSQKDMNAYISGNDALRDHFRCVVGTIHHTGKEDGRGLRGSSALYAAMDTVIRTDRKAGKMLVTLKNQQPHGKQKDASEFDDIVLEARVIGLGATDKKGRELTSLALELSDARPENDDEDGAEPRSPGGYSGPRGTNQQAVMAALKKAKGEPLGLMRLVGMTRLDESKIMQAVRPLVAKGLVSEAGEEGGRRWVLA